MIQRNLQDSRDKVEQVWAWPHIPKFSELRWDRKWLEYREQRKNKFSYDLNHWVRRRTAARPIGALEESQIWPSSKAWEALVFLWPGNFDTAMMNAALHPAPHLICMGSNAWRLALFCNNLSPLATLIYSYVLFAFSLLWVVCSGRESGKGSESGSESGSGSR